MVPLGSPVDLSFPTTGAEMQGIGCGEDTIRMRDPKPSWPSPPYPQPHTCPISETLHRLKYIQNIKNLSVLQKYCCLKIPDNANVCRPPAATVAILTPGFNATKHGEAERGSSPDDELSTACLADDTRLLFVLSSPTTLTSTLVDLDTWAPGLTVIHLKFSLIKSY